MHSKKLTDKKRKNFSKKDLGMAYHTPTLKKGRTQGEMPLPSFSPIPRIYILKNLNGMGPRLKQRSMMSLRVLVNQETEKPETKRNETGHTHLSVHSTWVHSDRIWEKGTLCAKRKFLPLFKLSPRQGLQSPWLLASFTGTLGLLVRRSNVKRYSMPSVSSGELPKWGIKRAISNRG